MLSIVGGLSVVLIGVNCFVKLSVKDRIITQEEAASLQDVDCILVLGAGVKSDGTPSLMLKDRILKGVSLYEDGVSPVILMSGDHGTQYYDEVNCMKNVAMEQQVPSSAIFMDHAGFSTYDSMYRAKNIFEAEKIVIVTQEYHMYRALYDAKKMGLEAYGVSADTVTYHNQWYRDIREWLARIKDLYKCMVKPTSQILGEKIPLGQSGDITNDK